MTKRSNILFSAFMLCMAAQSTDALAAVSSADIPVLEDSELSSIAGLGVQVSTPAEGAARFSFQHDSASLGRIEGSGDVSVLDKTSSFNPGILINNSNTLVLRDNAQNHLTSLVNINAVNSAVQVLLNLNININSQIGSILQANKAAQ